MTHLNEFTIAEARDALRKGDATATDLTMACLTAIDAGDGFLTEARPLLFSMGPWVPFFQ